MAAPATKDAAKGKPIFEYSDAARLYVCLPHIFVRYVRKLPRSWLDAIISTTALAAAPHCYS